VNCSTVQIELRRLRQPLDCRVSAVSGEEVREYFANVAKPFEARTDIRPRAAEGPCIMHGKGRAMRTLRLYIETSVWPPGTPMTRPSDAMRLARFSSAALPARAKCCCM
jgi:hypothetical protein